MSYKLHLDLDGITYNIQRLGNSPCSFGRNSDNVDYQQFLKDVKKQGIGIVEGPTVGVTTTYDIARKAEYPPIEDQLDKIYHTSLTAWKADIKAIKDKYPKSQVGVTTIAAVPDWVSVEAGIST